jgi:hypothetical protein
MSEAPEVQSVRPSISLIFFLLFRFFLFSVSFSLSQPADVPVHVHLVLAQGSTKTRAEYLEAEFAAIRAASTVSQLNQRIREAQKVLSLLILILFHSHSRSLRCLYCLAGTEILLRVFRGQRHDCSRARR